MMKFLIINMVTLLLACALGLEAAVAKSGCKRPPMARTWVNPEPKLNELSKLVIHYNCGEKPIKAYDRLSAALWVVKAYTRCARTECTWGRAQGNTMKDGRISAIFSTFSALRTITIEDEGGLIKVSLNNTYRDARRKPDHLEYFLHPKD